MPTVRLRPEVQILSPRLVFPPNHAASGVNVAENVAEPGGLPTTAPSRRLWPRSGESGARPAPPAALDGTADGADIGRIAQWRPPAD
jgi:hypothetical protein